MNKELYNIDTQRIQIGGHPELASLRNGLRGELIFNFDRIIMKKEIGSLKKYKTISNFFLFDHVFNNGDIVYISESCYNGNYKWIRVFSEDGKFNTDVVESEYASIYKFIEELI